MEILQEMQLRDKKVYGDIKYGFIFGGEDFIFEGRSFDVSNQISKSSQNCDNEKLLKLLNSQALDLKFCFLETSPKLNRLKSSWGN